MIISRFTDYYDFLSTLYGVDHKYRYNRGLLDLDNLYKDNIKCLTANNKLLEIFNPIRLWNSILNNFDFYWLIICGRQFLIYKEKSDFYWEVVTKDCNIYYHLDIIKSKNKDKSRYHRTYEFSWKKPLEAFTGGIVYPTNLKFNIANQHPIIVASNCSRKEFLYFCHSPKLGEIKNFVKLYPAEQIYQDIDYFFLNQIHGSPDTNPPVEVSEKIKIESKGFDLKYSFRPKIKK